MPTQIHDNPPIAPLGSTCAAIQYGRNDTRIYFQGGHGHVYESRGRDVSRAHYKAKVLVDPKYVRPHTPIAVVIHAQRIHVYYINHNNHIAEMRSNIHDSSSFEQGSELTQKDQLAARNSGFLYAISDDKKIRVGYQTGETHDYGKVHELEFNDNAKVWTDFNAVNLAF